MLWELSGRSAVVTGVSRREGIGYAIAHRLAERGANLMLQGLATYDKAVYGEASDITTVFDLERTYGIEVDTFEADFTHPNAPQQVITAARTRFGHVDILIANHAYSVNGALEDLNVEHIDKHLLANVRGTLLLVQAFAAQHDDRKGGRVIMMTSGQHLGPMPGELAYIASKGALHQLTRSLSAHLIPRGITVNTVNPGATDTGYADEELHATILAQQPQGRWGEPDDAARIIAWLCTDAAQWITGQVINSTGGGP